MLQTFMLQVAEGGQVHVAFHSPSPFMAGPWLQGSLGNAFKGTIMYSDKISISMKEDFFIW